ncbi:MAG: DUF1819 family protein [Coriobacteriaceae bacterium]|nr:MAG: DUF1819 family protein [Coriobacteriaceae bacterium]
MNQLLLACLSEVSALSRSYSLSMSGSSARVQESLLAARLYLDLHDWAAARKKIIDDNLFQLNAASSRERVSGEIVKRLRQLTDGEVEFFVSAIGDDRYAMLWVAICRTYQFVRDLSEQVIVTRYEHSMPDFPQEAYDVFFEEQAEIHPELGRMTDLGQKKMRNTVLRLLVDCHLVNSDRRITPLLPSASFKEALDPEHASDLAIFPGRVL